MMMMTGRAAHSVHAVTSSAPRRFVMRRPKTVNDAQENAAPRTSRSPRPAPPTSCVPPVMRIAMPAMRCGDAQEDRED